MKKRKLKSLNLNKKLISNLQSNEVYGGTATGAETLTPIVFISYMICPEQPEEDTTIAPGTNRVCDESIKICV